MIKKLFLILSLFIASIEASEFEKGSIGVGLSLGVGSMEVANKTQQYTLAGANIDYFVIDDFSVGLRYLGWFGGTPSLSEVSLPLNYYYPYSKSFRPFGGVFIKQTFASDGYSDYNSYGARIGGLMNFSKRAYLRIGIVQENYSDCTWHKECSIAYPEAVLLFAF